MQNADLELISVTDLSDNDVSSSFEFDNTINKVKTVDEFYYGLNGNEYSFKFKSTFSNEEFTEIINISLQNIVPTINFPINPISIDHGATVGELVGIVRGANGTVKDGFEFSDITFELVSQTQVGGKYAVSSSGQITTETVLTPDKSDTLQIKVIDSDGVTESSIGSLTINTSSTQRFPFYISSIGYFDSSSAENKQTSVLKYHTGVSDTPIVGDFVYTYFPNLGQYTVFNTQGQWFTMSENPQLTAIPSFKTNSTGEVVEISTQ